MVQKLPQHVAIVMDGNGRWAESRGLLRIEGHRAGVQTVKNIVRACVEKKIPCLSLFTFSCENWSRPADEVDFLMQLFLEALDKELQELNEHGICVRFTGNRNQLSEKLQQQMLYAETLTAGNNTLILNIAVNYSGKWDILQAVKKISLAVKNGLIPMDEINEAHFSSHLNASGLPEPDLFIRTSGEVRISNFFLWQLAYTELYFTDVHWPAFTVSEFEKALTIFGQRQRRYGQLPPLSENKGIDYA